MKATRPTREQQREQPIDGDIFDHLGFSPHESLELKIKADLWRDLVHHIQRRKLDPAALATALGVHQPDVSNLLRGKLSKFSTAKLITFAVRLNLGVQVKLTRAKLTSTKPAPAKPAKASKKRPARAAVTS